MAKKSKIAKNDKRQVLSNFYLETRNELRAKARNINLSPKDRLSAMKQLQSMSRDSSAIRYRKRCKISGRARGIVGALGIARHLVREFIGMGYLPGLKKKV